MCSLWTQWSIPQQDNCHFVPFVHTFDRMKRYCLLVMFFLSAFFLCIQGREVTDISQGWEFYPKEKPPVSVDLPHDSREFLTGTIKYRKNLSLKPEQGKRYFLEMEGIGQKARILVNGRLAGENSRTFSRFCVEITGYLKELENRIEIIMDNQGVLGKVMILETGPVCISPETAKGGGVIVSQERVTHSEGKIRVSTALASSSNKAETISIIVEVRDPRGYVAADSHREVKLAPLQKITDEQELTLIHPLLWQGRDNPYMHQVSVRVVQGEKEWDKVLVPLGLRKLEYDPARGLVLNGHYLKGETIDPFLIHNGKTKHSLQEKEEAALEFMRRSKPETVWLLTNGQSREFYDKCDREGFILCQKLLPAPFKSESDLYGIKAGVFQKRSHPSICFWSVSLSHSSSEDFETVMACIETFDPERIVICEIPPDEITD